MKQFLSVCLLLSIIGCSNQPKLVPVEGTVSYQNKPLVPGSIWLIPTSGGEKASGLLQTDGSFKLRTFPHGDGVIPGSYKVIFTLGGGVTKDLALLTNEAKTPLTVEIPPEGKQGWTIQLPLPN